MGASGAVPGSHGVFSIHVIDIFKIAITMTQAGQAPLSTARCAALVGIPLFRVERALRLLKRSGVVSMMQGRHGGFVLTHGGQTSMLDLLRAGRRVPEPTGFPALDDFLARVGREVESCTERVAVAGLATGNVSLEGAS
jgi:hypothetical protein